MRLIGRDEVFAEHPCSVHGALINRAAFAGIAVFLMIIGPGTLRGQTPASESEKDPVVMKVLGPRARRPDRIDAYLRRVQIENLLKTFGDSGANRVTRELTRRQLIAGLQKPHGKELLLELIKNRKDLEGAAVTVFAEAQPELSDVQLVRDVLFSLVVSASTGDIATRAAVGIIRQVQEAYLWRGVDSTVDTAGLGHALTMRIQSSTGQHWRDGVLKKLYDEASNRRKHASDPSEVDFFEAILGDLHDYAPPPSSIEEDRRGKDLPRKSGARAILRGVVVAGIVLLGAYGIMLLVKGLMNRPEGVSTLDKAPASDSKTEEKSQRLVPVLTDLPPEEIEGKTVLVRADLNFLNEWGKLMSNASFEHLLPTLRLLQEHKAEKIILLGTAQSAVEGVKEIFDMQRIGDALQAQLKFPVLTLKRWTGSYVANRVDQTPPGHIVLLGNIGADPREKEENEKKRQALVDEILATLKIELYVNDAPQASKHVYASTSELARKVPKAVAGPLLDAVISGQGMFSKKQQNSAIRKLPGARALLTAAMINSRIGRVSSAMSSRTF